MLRGEEPVESIDLSHEGLGVASAVLIASMVSSNTVIKSLKSVRHTQMQALRQQPLTAADHQYALLTLRLPLRLAVLPRPT